MDALWIPSKKVDSLPYICRIPSKKTNSYIGFLMSVILEQ